MRYNEVEVLLVEDNPHEAQLTLRTLKQFNLGNRLLHLDDSTEALDFIFARGQYANNETTTYLKVIFLDLKLPKVDGLEVLRQIKSNEKTKHIPVVFFTSSSEESDVRKAYELGANGYTVKPIDYETFNAAITSLGDFWIKVNQPCLPVPLAKK